MRIAVFEDDREFAVCLERLISQHTHHPTAINTGDAGEMLRWTKKASEPVLYLLDIVLDSKTVGFSIAKYIAEHQTGSLIVFITAFPQHIRYNSAFKTKAFNVILKSSPELEQEIKKTLSLAEQALQAKCLVIMGKFENLYIPHASICYIEAVKGTNKLCVHCVDGQYVILETLKNLQEQLALFGFVRCHKSIIVNTANIRARDKSSMILTFHNGASCPYSYLMQGGLDGIV